MFAHQIDRILPGSNDEEAAAGCLGALAPIPDAVTGRRHGRRFVLELYRAAGDLLFVDTSQLSLTFNDNSVLVANRVDLDVKDCAELEALTELR